MSISPALTASEPSAKKPKLDDNGALLDPSVGRPRYRPGNADFVTQGGVRISRTVTSVDDVTTEVQGLIARLNTHRGCIFESAYEYPGRYARWTMGFADPPLVFQGWSGPRFTISALNARGVVLLDDLYRVVVACEAVREGSVSRTEKSIEGAVLPPAERFAEEKRSQQNSIFSVIRAVIAMMSVDTRIDPQLGLYGAFGYDLTFQFDAVKRNHKRDAAQREIVLYIPDEILVHDNQLQQTWKLRYEFTSSDGTKETKGMPREGAEEEMKMKKEEEVTMRRDHVPGEYAKTVAKAREEFRVGNLFEVVMSQTFFEPCDALPSEVFERLRERNPSPYMFMINLGQQEFLVGASPEMFVRVERLKKGLRVETCPISGTIKRGKDPLEDADRIKDILSNKKEESELTMCTDVDRNDKSRICQPGSVQVIGRRQIEKYSKLIHTVDHVEGYLREGYDALDAFLVHTWAVTVSGCPKSWAMQFIEDNEKSPRDWYGGAVGYDISIYISTRHVISSFFSLLAFDGTMNTGLTLRTIRIKSGVAEVRAGATLLYDSVPEDEEKETELKASAFREAVLVKKVPSAPQTRLRTSEPAPGKGKKVVLIDHQDSFVNILASYFRETGADVVTIRFGISKEQLEELKPSLVVLSPGPGTPKDFKCSETLAMLESMKVPVFGVCLGLQAMVEYFGGSLDVLGYPLHGKPSVIRRKNGSKWRVMEESVPEEFTVARYHSLYANRKNLPDVLTVTAETLDESRVIMAVEHKTLPFAGLQFHPESIITGPTNGLQLLINALQNLGYNN